jgi:hypothetical protein
LFAAGVAYLNVRSFLLDGVTPALLLLILLFAGVQLAGYLRGTLSGGKWLGYLAYLACFYIAAVYVRERALIPTFAPQYFLGSEAIVRRHGLSGLGRFLTAQDFQWFTMHVAGVLLFLFAIIRNVLAGLYLSAMTWHLSFDSPNGAPPWLALKTARYRHVAKNVIGTTIAMALAYVLVSGEGYMWWTYEFPKLLTAGIHRILHGAQ